MGLKTVILNVRALYFCSSAKYTKQQYCHEVLSFFIFSKVLTFKTNQQKSRKLFKFQGNAQVSLKTPKTYVGWTAQLCKNKWAAILELEPHMMTRCVSHYSLCRPKLCYLRYIQEDLPKLAPLIGIRSLKWESYLCHGVF